MEQINISQQCEKLLTENVELKNICFDAEQTLRKIPFPNIIVLRARHKESATSDDVIHDLNILYDWLDNVEKWFDDSAVKSIERISKVSEKP
jgi:hypothetical protein